MSHESIHHEHAGASKPEWLQAELKQLPSELAPERDLWPEIAQQISKPARQRWLPAAVAASVLVSAMSAVFTWQLYQQRSDDAALASSQQLLQQIESPYQLARTSYAEQWPTLKTNLDPETAATVERNLQIIRTAHEQLAKALNKQPDDPALQQLLRQTLAKEIEVYQLAENASRVSI
ncbi:hypothetical protein HPT27_06480 [Permianibacter sp. IMCC34836]|uniref:hypothetical protein n=1 Tax=Permianibacter fluminis TaxID=2738515 RepID=UPI001557DDF2|nr:hypothetical protein [Permianibacter fluminis]NQD36665.1 hypothetical protein [Permianibacter fluminis]